MLIVLPKENHANKLLIKSRAAVPTELQYADLLIWMDLSQAVAFSCIDALRGQLSHISTPSGKGYRNPVSTGLPKISELLPLGALHTLFQFPQEDQLLTQVTQHGDSGRPYRIIEVSYECLSCHQSSCVAHSSLQR